MLPKKPDRAELTAQILAFVSERTLLSPAAIDECAPLGGLGIDSFSLLEIVVLLERQFGITLPHEQLTPENLGSVSGIVQTALTHLERTAQSNAA